MEGGREGEGEGVGRVTGREVEEGGEGEEEELTNTV